jgi:uncharacterized protein
MATQATPAHRRNRVGGEVATWSVTLLLLAAGSLYPSPGAAFIVETVAGLVALAPVVIMASLLAGALAVGSWSGRMLAVVQGGPVRAIVLASAAGALTPVCGLGVLPLIAAFLRQGLPLAPVMAFWVSSPVMGPAMVIVTIGVLGVDFAAAKALSALGVGLLAGLVTHWLPGFREPGHSLMRNGVAADKSCTVAGFWRESWNSARLVLRWLVLALVLEVLLQKVVPEAWIQSVFGAGNAGSVPLAALIGAPLYVDGYAALPLVRGLMEMGMGFGAALAFMVSGAAVSLYAAVAVAALVQLRVFVLYIGLAALGAVTVGYIAELLGPAYT